LDVSEGIYSHQKKSIEHERNADIHCETIVKVPLVVGWIVVADTDSKDRHPQLEFRDSNGQRSEDDEDGHHDEEDPFSECYFFHTIKLFLFEN